LLSLAGTLVNRSVAGWLSPFSLTGFMEGTVLPIVFVSIVIDIEALQPAMTHSSISEHRFDCHLPTLRRCTNIIVIIVLIGINPAGDRDERPLLLGA
jgi:hypothetical protein